jgi:glutamate-1-semialdehyde 2,1-aminomutase
VYGSAGPDDVLDEGAAFDPITPYARSKVQVEADVSKLADDDFSPVYLRNATVYGVSPRLRGDLVVNNLVGWAFTTGRVLLKSDGTPWRPLVHVEDVSRAFLAALLAPREVVHNQAFNVGRSGENYRIRDVAERVEAALPGSRIDYAEGAGPDPRCYRVDFAKIESVLPEFRARWTVERGVAELRDAYRAAGLRQEDLEGDRYLRIRRIRTLLEEGSLDADLRWTHGGEPPRVAPLRLDRTRELQRRSHAVIPGGAHTYAKGDDQYPELAPGFIARGRGCRVWDVDGNEFIEYGMGLRAVTLGHAHPAVLRAAREAMEGGVNFTRPHPLEVECAEELVGLIEHAEMAKFTKDGSTATTAAVTLARAHTGRDLVALCADHPFFSYDGWFMGTTEMDAGIPQAVKDLTLRFRYNDLDSVRALFAEHPDGIAALVLEPSRGEDPRDGFLHELRRLCSAHGTVLVFDEMITGFRWHLGGAQAYYGVAPDLSTFGKALANGFSVSALVGRREIMERGGLRHPGPRVFLLSTTHGAETHGLAAALATMRIYQREPVIEHLWRQGEALARGFGEAAAELGVAEQVQVVGRPCNLAYVTRDREGRPSQAFRSLFLQETLARGVMMPSLVVSYAHGDADIEQTLEAVRGALAVYRDALEDGVERFLVGRPSQLVFRRFN